jgi:hypothetical protein
MIQPIVMDEVPLGSASQASSLNFIARYCSELEVLENQFLPVSVGPGQPGNGRYFRPRFPGMTNCLG